MALSPKQQAFVYEYLIDLNATQAAIRAGYSAKTANNQVGRLLVNIGIQNAIQEAFREREARTQITQDETLQGLADIAFITSDELSRWPGGKLSDKTRALELLMKHLGMFDVNRAKPEETVNDSFELEFKKAVERITAAELETYFANGKACSFSCLQPTEKEAEIARISGNKPYVRWIFEVYFNMRDVLKFEDGHPEIKVNESGQEEIKLPYPKDFNANIRALIVHFFFHLFLPRLC